ncbi:hypothetical protein UlMin_042187 [Ulmus minor]
MKNYSILPHYDFGNDHSGNIFEAQMFDEIPHRTDNQQQRIEGYPFPVHAPFLTAQRAAFPSSSSSCDINNISHHQSMLLGNKILAPQFEQKDFQAIRNARKRPIEVNDLLPKSCISTSLNEEWGKSKRNKVTNYNQSKQIQEPGLQLAVKKSQKLSDKITSLQKLVSPYGKTDTASVLQEANLYIKLLHEQIQQNLFRMMSSSYDIVGGPLSQGSGKGLRSKGLCLVPIWFTKEVTMEESIDNVKFARF